MEKFNTGFLNKHAGLWFIWGLSFIMLSVSVSFLLPIMFEGDVGLLFIGAGLFILVYLLTNFLIWRKKRKTTFHADVIAPVAAFILSILWTIIIWPYQEWAMLWPIFMLIGIIPTSLLLTLIKIGIVLSRKSKKNSE